MKFIKIQMSRGDDLTFPSEEAKKILTDENQIVPITERDGKWYGRVINKAHIVSSNWDYDAEEEDKKFTRLEEENKKRMEDIKIKQIQ